MRSHFAASILLGLASGSCGDDPGRTGVSADELESFCERRCEFQASCVPELREIIGECRRQCRSSFDNPELYTHDCAEPSLIAPGDPNGPYTVDSVVEYQECLIERGCGATENPCEEIRELCIDGLTIEERCERETRRGYQACGDAYTTCIRDDRTDCSSRNRRCRDEVQRRHEACG